MSREVILTGIRSNDEPTLGNFLGAFLPMVELQRKRSAEYQLNMFVPDLHSFTTPIDHKNLYENTIRNVMYFAAAGLDIDDENTFIYRQSHIPAHSELTWILSCFTYFGELSRMTQFKDKSQSGHDQISVGLFSYPVLMAADILLYGAKWVPVGEDQKQHLELTRDLAIRMNNKFGNIFTVPHEWQKQLEFAGRDKGVKIRSLRNPAKKMSKSVEDPAGTILLSDSPDSALEKIKAATTDSIGVINYNFDDQPGITNLLQILALATGQSQADVNARWIGKTNYGELKQATAEAVAVLLKDFQLRLNSVDRNKVIDKLLSDEESTTRIANDTLERVQRAIGLF